MTMGLGMGRFASPETSLVFAALRNQNDPTSSFRLAVITLSSLIMGCTMVSSC